MDLNELCGPAAEQMLVVAVVERERRAYLDAHADVFDGNGHRLVVVNGDLPTREVATLAGQGEVKAPRVREPRQPGYC